MMSQAAALVALIAITITATGSQRQDQQSCENPLLLQDGVYPNHRYSPSESFENYDVVLHGEVIVPTRKCSLGYCAGIKILRALKGYEGKEKTIVRVSHHQEAFCTPPALQNKGRRWVLYGTRKKTAGGTSYVEVGVDHPNFPTFSMPNFETLESDYFLLRTRLDYAIDKKSSPAKTLR